MRDLIVLAVLLIFIVPGLTRPYLAFAGYLWVDTITPQGQVFGFLAGKPISIIMAIVCFLSLVLGAKKLTSSQSRMIPFLFILFIFWTTISTINAQFEIFAWPKWDASIKTLIMAFLLIFTITNQKQLEMVLLVLFFSLMFYMASSGPKTILSGGGYGVDLILNGSNSGWSESSTLSCLAVMTLPLINYFRQHITLFPFLANKNSAWLTMAILCISTLIGTTARTGLIALIGYIGIKSLNFRNFLKIFPLLIVISITAYQIAPQSWIDRMNTTKEYQTESSSAGRIAVWRWTVDYVADKPLGGGFNSYIANAGQLGEYDQSFANYTKAKAFHSIYFEVLGEQGYIGLLIFISLIFSAIQVNRTLIKRTDTSIRIKDFCFAMNHTIYIFCIGGLFIGVAYKPIIYQLIALTVVHHTIVIRELNLTSTNVKL